MNHLIIEDSWKVIQNLWIFWILEELFENKAIMLWGIYSFTTDVFSIKADIGELKKIDNLFYFTSYLTELIVIHSDVESTPIKLISVEIYNLSNLIRILSLNIIIFRSCVIN